MNQLISVCIPVYNGVLYIEETLKSLLAQTYRNIEIIVFDNASTDNTAKIVKSLCEVDKRIKYYRNKTNIGYCKNILSAVKKASSEFVAIYHADDLYKPSIIEKQYNVLLNDNSVHGVFVKLESFTSNGRLSKPKIYKELLKSNLFIKEKNLIVGNYNDYLPFVLEFGNLFPCPCFMTRKNLFLKIGGFKDTYLSNEDLELWIKYLQNGYKLAIINEFLFKYRMSEEHASAFWRKSTELPIMYKVIDEMIMPSIQKRDENLTELYVANKAQGYILAGYNAYLQRKYSKMKENINKSVETYIFKITSPFGFAQRFPKISCYIKNKINSIIYKKFLGIFL